MKKVFSVFLSLLISLSSISTFAAIEIDPNLTTIFYSDLNNFKDGDAITEPFGINNSHPIDGEFKNGQFVASRKDGSTTTGLTYLFFGKHKLDNYVFGFDIKFSGLTSNTGTGVYSVTPGTDPITFQDQHAEKIVSIEGSNGYDSTGKFVGSKTAWCFYKSGKSKSINFTVKKDGSSLVTGKNGKPAVFLGDAQLEQDNMYTLKVFVDNINKTYNAIIVDTNGTVLETGISGSVQDAFNTFHKLDNSIQAGVNDTATVTLDNLFVINTKTAIHLPTISEVTADGKIQFSAYLPDDLENPAVYINNTFVENLTLTPGVTTNYFITSALPSGTRFGEAIVEIRGTLNGSPISISDTTVISKKFEHNVISFETPDPNFAGTFGLRSCSNGGMLSIPADTPGVWALSGGVGQIDITSLNPTLSGIVDFSFDFKSAQKLEQIRLRMTANTSNGAAFRWEGGNDTYRYFSSGYPYLIGSKKIDYTPNEWNTLLVRADFYNHKYYAYINGTLAEEGSFTDIDGETNKVQDVRMILKAQSTDDLIYLDNFNFKEYNLVSEHKPTISATYYNATSLPYNNSPIPAAVLSGVVFETNIPFDSASITNETAKLVNWNGEKVNTSLSYHNGTFKMGYEGDTLPDGEYRLFISKNATLEGSKFGIDFEIPIEFESSSYLISPFYDSTVSGDVEISYYSADADKIVFAVDDETIASIENHETTDFIYSCTYSSKDLGTKFLDVYIHKDDDVRVMSSKFIYSKNIDSNFKANYFNLSTDVKPGSTTDLGVYLKDSDPTKGNVFQVTSKVGNGASDLSKSCVDFPISSSDSFRILATEFDIKVAENTYVNFEIGASLTGQPYATNSASYRTVYFRGSSEAKGSLFGKDGTILGTTKTFEPNKWYKVKQIIDYENLTVSYYIDNQLLITDVISDANIPSAVDYPDWREKITTTNKFRVLIFPIDRSKASEEGDNLPARITLDNQKRWIITSLPSASTVNESKDFIITEGTDKVSISLTKAFDNDIVNPFSSDLIKVFVNGKKFDADITVKDGANFTVAGLKDIKGSSKIEIHISDLAFFNGGIINKIIKIPVYVKNTNGLCIFPIIGDSSNVYVKYINGSDETDYNLFLSSYDKTSGKMISAKVPSVDFSNNTSGVYSCKIPQKSASPLFYRALLSKRGTITSVVPQFTYETVK